jgi:hypothetical protein
MPALSGLPVAAGSRCVATHIDDRRWPYRDNPPDLAALVGDVADAEELRNRIDVELQRESS